MPTLLELAVQSKSKPKIRRSVGDEGEEFELLIAWLKDEIGLTAANYAFNKKRNKSGNTMALTRFAYATRRAFQSGKLIINNSKYGDQDGIPTT